MRTFPIVYEDTVQVLACTGADHYAMRSDKDPGDSITSEINAYLLMKWPTVYYAVNWL